LRLHIEPDNDKPATTPITVATEASVPSSPSTA
jgi:hypothetical protein